MRSRDGRLARLAARSVNAALRDEHQRNFVETRAAIADAVRLSLTKHGIDPATVSALRHIDGEADAAAPATSSPQPDDPPPFVIKIERLAQHYLDHPTIDFGKASLMQVLAWCVARHNDTCATSGET
jgi:hypothetical protein